MRLRAFLFERHRDKTALAVAVAASIFLMTRGEESKTASARVISSFLLTPATRIEAYFDSMEALRAENRRLRKLAASLYHERDRLVQQGRERDRLRRLLDLREESPFHFLTCEVIARSSSRFHQAVTVDRGEGDEARAGMAVVGYRGLVGRVTQAFDQSSRVLLINNKAIAVSCRDSRSGAVGILEWERGNHFRLEYVGREEDVTAGDTLLTSGLGRLFPEGFPVGIVTQVSTEPGNLSRRIGVVAMADLYKLEELFIVVSGEGWDAEAAFEELERRGEEGETP